jgi:2-polyprenyl-3-methyl-5-hydroxy-6-metoxy-1,4-benzoquinol methylase
VTVDLDKNDVRAFYNRMWSHYDRGLSRHERERFAAVIALVRGLERSNKAILDAGCGLGKLSELLLPYGEVTATDWSDAGIEAARQRVSEARFLTLDFVRDDIAPLIGQFGLVVSSEVVEHVGRGNRLTFVRNLAACLVPGGFLILTTPNKEVEEALPKATQTSDDLSKPESWHQPEDDLLTVEETLELVERAGLRVLRCGSATFLEGPWERSSKFRRLRSLLPRDRLGRDFIDRLLARTRFGVYTVVLARRENE